MGLWYYVSFADASLPEGKQFLGATYIHLESGDWNATGLKAKRESRHVMERAKAIGVYPGGEAMIIPVEPFRGTPPEEMRERLVSTREEITRINTAWMGDGGRGVSYGEWRDANPDAAEPDRACAACIAGLDHEHN